MAGLANHERGGLSGAESGMHLLTTSLQNKDSWFLSIFTTVKYIFNS